MPLYWILDRASPLGDFCADLQGIYQTRSRKPEFARPCRVWAERVRFWLRDNVMAALLVRMTDASRRATSQQQLLGTGLVIMPLPPDDAQMEALELPSDEDLQRAVAAARQAAQAQASAPPAGGGGLFGGGAASAQQTQEHAARVKALQVAHKVRSRAVLMLLKLLSSTVLIK